MTRFLPELGRYAERTAEAGWLLAVVVTPLIFVVDSHEVFESSKTTAFRSIALILLVAALVRTGERGWFTRALHGSNLAAGWQWTRTRGLVLAAALWVGNFVLSTLTSIAPRESFWGSLERMQGTYTMICYVIVFLTLVLVLRRRNQLELVITTIVLVSLPVALYGLLQRGCADPILWQQGTVARVSSTMGNPTFLSGFLIMCVPITLLRVISILGGAHAGERNLLQSVMTGAGYVCVLLIQLLAILYSQSRGAWLGLLAGVHLFGLLGLLLLRRHSPGRRPLELWDVARAIGFGFVSFPFGIVPAFGLWAFRRRGLHWLWLSWLIASLLAAGGLVSLSVIGSNASLLRATPSVGRLGRLFETEGGSGRTRLLIWEGVSHLVAPHAPLWSPTSGPDRLNAIRPLVGYGPEMMLQVFPRFAPAELARLENRRVDRSHNEIFDRLVETGLLGLLSYLVVIALIFDSGLAGMRLIQTPRDRATFVAIWVTTGTLAALVTLVWDRSWRLCGLAFSAGMILALVVYVAATALRQRLGQWDGAESPNVLVLIALLSTITAHLVDLQFGIATTATRLYFWVCIALLVIAGHGDAVPSEQTPAIPEAPTSVRGTLAHTLIVAFILSTLAVPFLGLSGEPLRHAGLWWLFGVTWLLSGVIVLGDSIGTLPTTSLVGRISLYGLVTIGSLVLSVGIHRTARLRGLDPASLPLIDGVLLLISIAVLAAALGRREAVRSAEVRGRYRPWWLYIAATAGASALLVTNLHSSQAEIYREWAWRHHRPRGQLDAAIAMYERALRLVPAQDAYHWVLAHALVEKALTLDHQRAVGVGPTGMLVGEQFALLTRAVDEVERARGLNPLRVEYTHDLGWVHQIWAARMPGRQGRDAELALSLRFYAQASELGSTDPQLYYGWGRTYALQGRIEEAIAMYERSIALGPDFPAVYVSLADAYRARTRGALGSGRSDDLARAEVADRRALELASAERWPPQANLCAGRRTS